MTTGEQRRDQGMVLTSANEGDSEWAKQADRVMQQLISEGAPFSANDFSERMGDLKPHHPSAVGALFGGYSRRGDILRAGTEKAIRPVSNARSLALWISKQAAQFRPSVIIHGDILDRLNEAIDDAANAPVTVFPRGYAQGLQAARVIINEEFNRKR